MASIPVGRREASSLGIMQIDADRRITRFVEKPSERAVQDSIHLDPAWYDKLGIKGQGELFLASMGIYVFNRDVMFKLLDNTLPDFGRDIIPNAISNYSVFSFVFQGYWEDIGTILAYIDVNMDVTYGLTRLHFYYSYMVFT